MTNLIAVGLGAALASALLFGAIGTGSAYAAVLSYAAPLPILIVAIGWNQRAALAAVAVAAIATAITLRPTTGFAYAVGSGLPGWWIGYLALLGRPAATSGSNVPSATGTEWYPLGRLLAWIAATGAIVTVAGALAVGGFDYAVYRSALSRLIEAFLRYESGVGREGVIPPMAGVTADRVVRVITAIIPLLAAAIFTLVFTANAWCAARVVAISGRLTRPWPHLPATRMPIAAVGLFACGALAMLAPGYPGVVGSALAGAFGFAFACQGLALLHSVTTGRPGRGALLGSIYILTIFFGGTMLPLLSLAGLVDSATPIRRRFTPPTGRSS